MIRTRPILAATVAALGLCGFAPAPGDFSVLLKPAAMDQAAGKGALDVTLRIPAADAPAGAAVLRLPVVIANTDTIATTLTGLSAHDDQGPVPLTVRDDAPAIEYSRHWIAGRAVKGTLEVRYRAPVDDTPPARGSGPPYSLRTEGGGLSGVGNTFILLPEGGRARPITLSWDTAALPQGSGAMSSFGEGEVHLPAGPPDRLHRALYMAGPMHREPAAVKQGGFSAAWLGEPPFDPRPLMVWAGRLHGWMSGFFKDPAEPPYRVILRYNPINAGGGAALNNSFLLTWGESAKDPEHLKGTLAHEMIHTWTATGLGGQWYGEGIAVHYQALLPWRAGMISTADFLSDINGTARRYYTNALNDTPDKEVGPRFWEDTRIRTLPYDRGALYFAVLDGKIRRASAGKRSLDDLITDMVRRRQSGKPMDEAAWLGLLDGALGPEGRRLHADMLAGKLMLPEASDFGPCFTRTTAKFRRFDLGFEPKSLVGDVKTIRGLDPKSEAARAGLKDGDVVTYAVALDSVQGDQTRDLTLKVTREGKTFPITYLPRGETVDAWQWARKPGVPDKACVDQAPPQPKPEPSMKVIDREEVREKLTYELCIPLVRQAMIALSRGETKQLLRSIIQLGGGRMFGTMPGALGERAMFGCKLVSVFPENFAKGVQSHQGVVALFDGETGAPICIVHAGEVTAIRTGAASAVATDVLARPDAHRLAILGYGEQAMTHARAIAQVRPLSVITIWGRDHGRAAKAAEALNVELGVPVTAALDVEAAVAKADIICTVSSAKEPILKGAWVAPGTHVNVVGSSFAGPTEVDHDLVVRSRFIADYRDGVLAQGAEFLKAKEAGLIGDDHVVGEIGQLLDGRLDGRQSPEQITIYKSLGHVVQDLAAAQALYEAV